MMLLLLLLWAWTVINSHEKSRKVALYKNGNNVTLWSPTSYFYTPVKAMMLFLEIA